MCQPRRLLPLFRHRLSSFATAFRKPDSSAYSCHDQQPQMSRQPAKTLDSDALQRPAAATSSPPASVSATGATLSRGERGEAEPSRGEAEEEPRSREAEEPRSRGAVPAKPLLCIAAPPPVIASLRCEQHACVCVCYMCDRRASASCALASTASLRLSVCVVIQTWKYQGQ